MSKARPVILFSLVAILAVVAVVRYTMLNEPGTTERPAKQRSLSKFMVTWACTDPACGFMEDRPGGQGPVTCPDCGKESVYPSFKASANGQEIRVWMIYGDDDQPVRVKYGKDDWIDYRNADDSPNLQDSQGRYVTITEVDRPIADDQGDLGPPPGAEEGADAGE